MSQHAPTSELNDRARNLLKTLVERYIQDGQPVGSRTLSRATGNALSPATIRNVMADLEDCGLVTSPHTSAGRVPTVPGYRFFVDSLLSVQPLTRQSIIGMKHELATHSGSTDELLRTASSLLSEVTQLAGVVMVPGRDCASLKQIEFMPLSDRRVLAILVVNNSEVQNRILSVDRDYTADELHRAANYLNTHFAGKGVSEVRSQLLKEMADARRKMDDLMREAVTLGGQALGEGEKVDQDVLLSGETKLMQFDELCEVGRLRGLFEAFTEKSGILAILDRCMLGDGIQIFIGDESGYQVLDECSVVTAPYEVDGETLGVLGVIGPTRMAYERAIPIVDATARLLGAALGKRH